MGSTLSKGQQKSAFGIESSKLHKKTNVQSPERLPARAVQTHLKFGISLESPFLGSHPHSRPHPSTDIIFGEPDKKVRPMTSKINSVLRKSLNGRKLGKAEIDSAFKNSFGQFAKKSQSVEKQKVYSYMYGSSPSMKLIRAKMGKGTLCGNKF